MHTCDEAIYTLKLYRTAGQIALDDTAYNPYGIKAGGFPLDQPSDRDKSMEISILEAYCALIQGWRMFRGTPCYVQEIPLPLQLSFPMLYKYCPNSRYLNNDEMENLLRSCREEKRLRLSCFARRGQGKLRRAKKQPVPVSPIASYCLSSATTNTLSMFGSVGDSGSDETRYVGSVLEMTDCLELVMDDIRGDAEGQLTAWEQLYVRACVKFYFLHFWTTRPPPVKAGWSKSGAEQQE